MEAENTDSDSDGYEENPEPAQNEEEGEKNSVCLFCESMSATAEATFAHMKNDHRFDIVEFYTSNALDFYSYLKFVNYVRKHRPGIDDILKISTSEFQDEVFLCPTIGDDPLLQIDVEEDLLPTWSGLTQRPLKDEKDQEATSDLARIIGILEFKLNASERRAKETEESLCRAINDLNQCKAELNRCLLSSGKETEASRFNDKHVDTHYFDSYSHLGIHEEMLKDKVRTEAYGDFIRLNGDLFKGKTVLDIGCGTGILSMFAAKAGAKRVVGVDQSEMAYTAMDIIRENGLHNVVTIIKDRAENLSKREDIGKFDVIVSEWMGYFLLFENMLSTVLFCRDNLLNPDGSVYPDCLSLHLVAVMDQNFRKERIDYWDDVYGFKMTSVKNRLKDDAIVDYVTAESVISEPTTITTIQMMTDKATAQEFESKFVLPITRDGFCTALVGYFDTHFNHSCTHPVFFSTGPMSPPTHWKQTVFLLEDEIAVKTGEKLCGQINCKKLEKDQRSLQIDLCIHQENSNYRTNKRYFVC